MILALARVVGVRRVIMMKRMVRVVRVGGGYARACVQYVAVWGGGYCLLCPSHDG